MKKKIVCILTTISIITLMIGCSELLGEREIIFPEIAAIAIGMLLAPKRAWRTSKTKILLLITLSAMAGLSVSVLVPLPLWAKMALGFIIGQFMLAFSGTGFAPMISAAVLPIMLETKSLVYLAAAICLTALIVLCCLLLEKAKIRPSETYTPLPFPNKQSCKNIAVKIIIGTACIALAVISGWRFAAAPPMLVAFTELMNKNNKAVKMPVKTVLLVSVCALIGAVSRYVVCYILTLPLTVAALAATVMMLAVIMAVSFYLPPAGALTILAMLIPEDMVLLYPLQIAVGISVLMAIAVVYHKLTDGKKTGGRQHDIHTM